jgi:ketosteroid isomerase-like protein
MTLPTALRATTAPADGCTDDAVESFAEFRQHLETAALEIMNGDSRAWEELYSHAPDATLFGGWGGQEKGWTELAQRWQMVRGRYRAGTLRIERISEHISDDLAVTVEICRGDAAFSNGSSGPIALRVTHVCRREKGRWRLVHRHADVQMRLLPIQSHIEQRDAT